MSVFLVWLLSSLTVISVGCAVCSVITYRMARSCQEQCHVVEQRIWAPIHEAVAKQQEADRGR